MSSWTFESTLLYQCGWLGWSCIQVFAFSFHGALGTIAALFCFFWLLTANFDACSTTFHGTTQRSFALWVPTGKIILGTCAQNQEWENGDGALWWESKDHGASWWHLGTQWWLCNARLDLMILNLNNATIECGREFHSTLAPKATWMYYSSY